jgi:hypothetical protein
MLAKGISSTVCLFWRCKSLQHFKHQNFKGNILSQILCLYIFGRFLEKRDIHIWMHFFVWGWRFATSFFYNLDNILEIFVPICTKSCFG